MTNAKTPPPNKRAFFEARLATGSAFLHLDARQPGVLVPASFRENFHLVLQYGFALAIPIPDLRISDWGVRATLSFSRSPFSTAVPWPAIYAIHGDDGEAFIWLEDKPPDVELRSNESGADAREEPAAEPAEEPKKAVVKGRGHLKLVD